MPTKTRKPLNTVILQGRVATNLEYSTSHHDVPLLKFGLAVDSPDDIPKKIDRRGKVEPDFPYIVVTGPLASELVAGGQLKKNTDVYVRGSWRTRNVNFPRRMVVNEMWATVIIVLDSKNQTVLVDSAQTESAPPTVLIKSIPPAPATLPNAEVPVAETPVAPEKTAPPQSSKPRTPKNKVHTPTSKTKLPSQNSKSDVSTANDALPPVPNAIVPLSGNAQ